MPKMFSTRWCVSLQESIRERRHAGGDCTYNKTLQKEVCLQSAECSDCLYNTMLQRKGLLAVCNLQSVLAVHTTTCCRGKVCLQSAVCRVFWLYVQHHAAEERSACSLQSAVFWLYGCTHHVRTELNKFCGAILLISKNSLLTYSK